MKNYFRILMACAVTVTLSMTSCGGSSSSDKERIAELEDSIARLNSKMNDNMEYSTHNTSSDASSKAYGTESTNNSSSNSSNPSSLKEKAYKLGYDEGMNQRSNRLGYYTDDNEKKLKNRYITTCRSRYDGLGDENYNNRALYEEFKRGFLKGHEDGNNAL